MAKLGIDQLKNKISNKTLERAYLLYGEEKNLVKKFEKLITDLAIGDVKNDFNLFILDGETLDLEKLNLCLNTYPITSKNKCIIIKNIELESMDNEKFDDFILLIKDIPSFSTLIISQTSIQDLNIAKNPKWKNLLLAISSVGITTEFSFKDNKNIEDDVIFIAKKMGKTINKTNAKILIQKCGNSLGILKNEILKVCSYEEEDNISEKSINFVCNEQIDYTVFSMCNSLFWGNYSDMYKKLENIFDKNESPILILSAISSCYVDIFRVKIAIFSGKSHLKISEFFDYKGKSFKIDSAYKNSTGLDIDKISKSINCILKADEDLKNTSLPAKVVISSLLCKLIRIKEGI